MLKNLKLKNIKLNIAIAFITLVGVSASYGQFATTPQAEPTFSASPVKTAPRVSTFGVPIGSRTQERLNEPIAVDRVRCGQEDACFRGNDANGELSQDELVESRKVDPKTVDDGLYGSFSIGYSHHNNPDRRGNQDENSGSEESDSGLAVGLGLFYRNRIDRLSYQLGAQTGAVAFDKNDNNDFNSYSLSGGLLYELTEVIDLSLHAGYSRSDEERNSSGARIVDVNSSTDEVETKIVGAQVSIGRPQSRFQVVLAGSHSTEDYTITDDEVGRGAIDLRDKMYDHLGGTIFYNTEGAIRYFLEANVTDIDYDNDNVRNLDSQETGVYVGALWSISSITSAEVKVGKLEKDFSDSAIDDSNDTSYSAKLRWQPTQRAALTFYGSKRVEETTEIESNYFESQLIGVSMAYQLLPQKLDLVSYYNKIDDDFTSGREDKTKDYGIGFIYHPKRWISVGLRYGRSERESNLAVANYDDSYYDMFVQFNAAKSVKIL